MLILLETSFTAAMRGFCEIACGEQKRNEYLFMLMLPDAWPAPASVSHHQVSTGVTSEQIQHLSQTDAIIRIKRLNDPLSPVFGAEKSVLKIVSLVN